MALPALSASTRLLVVAPHPDDETLACGLLIQQVLAAGGAIRVLLLTDGDDNPWPQRWLERRWRIGAADRLRWGRRRRGEVARAMAKLGLPPSALQVMGWPDMGVTGRLCRDAAGTQAALGQAFDAFGPTLVVIPALEDRHPDHGAAHVLCRLALAACGKEPDWLAYPVHGRLPTAATSLGPAAAGQLQCKLQALHEHVTQMTLSRRRLLRLAARPERYVLPDEDRPAHGDGHLPWMPPRLLQPFLRVLVAEADAVSDHAWRDIVARDVDGYRLTFAHRGPGPRFVKLHLDWRSPWIFDHWGWCRA